VASIAAFAAVTATAAAGFTAATTASACSTVRAARAVRAARTAPAARVGSPRIAVAPSRCAIRAASDTPARRYVGSTGTPSPDAPSSDAASA
jgi:hypothetical protein